MAEISTLIRPRGGLTHERGVVVPTPDGVLRVRSDAGLHAAKVAVSCLVRPAPFDEVMLAVGEEDVYVLAVLERPTDAPLDLESDRDVALRARSLRLEAHETLDASAPTVQLRGERAEALFGAMSVLGGALETQITQVRAVGEKLEQVFGMLSARFTSSVRRVEGADVTHAGDVSTTSEGAYVLRTQDADLRAERLIRMDGEQIHMG